MADVTFQVAVAFGTQSVLGTADATIAALTGSLAEADGIVLGDPESGAGESGVSAQFVRALREKAVVSGSFTKQPSDFIGEEISGFEVAFAAKGNGAASPTLDADYTPVKGIDALFQACGLAGSAWGSGVGWAYVPASAQIVTAKLWLGDQAWVIKDIVGNLSADFEPGGIGVWTAGLSGKIDSFDAAAGFPTLNYGAQGSLSAPGVESVGHNWGISAASRGFSTYALSIDNETQEVPDSNAEAGQRVRQTGRTIGVSATIYADSGDIDFERSELIRTTAPTEEQTFTVGTAAASTANAYTVTLTNPELRSFTPDRLGDAYAAACELVAVDAAANGEFELIFV